MSVLKWKVAHAMNLRNENRKAEKAKARETVVMFKNEQLNIDIQEPRQLRKRVRQEQQINYFDTKKSTSSKNIMKNYSRALISFAISDLSIPYIAQEIEQYNLEVEQFKQFIRNNQESVNCIKGLRELLLAKETDLEQTKNFKRVFQAISIVFIKYFSVNWIFNSKVADKQTHLTYRFKILRRLEKPQYFTYLENFTK